MPNANGGMTAEEEQEWIARQMATANWERPPEVNPTPEQQYQQVADTMAAAQLTNNAGYQASLMESLAGKEPLGYGFGPPYGESAREYDGPPPLEASPDWEYSSGYPSDWHDYSSSNATTGGGFFNFDELYHGAGRAVPQPFTRGSNLPSTNNYRLLPPDFRQPNYIMRNGQIIDMNNINMYGPRGPGGMGDSPITNPSWRSGAAMGVPAAYATSPNGWQTTGWPGGFNFTYGMATE